MKVSLVLATIAVAAVSALPDGARVQGATEDPIALRHNQQGHLRSDAQEAIDATKRAADYGVQTAADAVQHVGQAGVGSVKYGSGKAQYGIASTVGSLVNGLKWMNRVTAEGLESAGNSVDGVAGRGQARAERGAAEAGEIIHRAGDATAETREKIANTAADARDAVVNTAADARDKTVNTAIDARDAVANTAADVQARAAAEAEAGRQRLEAEKRVLTVEREKKGGLFGWANRGVAKAEDKIGNAASAVAEKAYEKRDENVAIADRKEAEPTTVTLTTREEKVEPLGNSASSLSTAGLIASGIAVIAATLF